MDLLFSTYFPWTDANGHKVPTNFKARILRGLGDLDQDVSSVKLHTMRRVLSKPRFRAGMNLRLCVGSRFYKEPFMNVECTGTQLVSMSLQTIPKAWANFLVADIDGKACSNAMLETLARNDGFPRSEERGTGPSNFTRWFMLDLLQNGPGTYELIHWTNTRY